MIDKKSIIAFSKKVYKKSQGIPDRKLFHPHREWVIGLVATLSIVVGGALYILEEFEWYKTIYTIPVTVENTVPEYRNQVVTNALSLYESRKQLYDARKIPTAGAPEVVLNEVVAEAGTSTASSSIEVATTTPETSATPLDVE